MGEDSKKPQIEPKSSKTNITREEIDDMYKQYKDNDYEFDVDNFYKKYNISDDEAERLGHYQGWWYYTLNTDLRNGVGNPDFIEWMSSAMKKLPKYEWETYRWINMTNDVYKKFADLKVWDTFSDAAYLSTSTDRKMANNFMGDGSYSRDRKVMMHIKSKNWRYIWNAWESEILFDKWTQFKVTDKSTKKTPFWETTNLYLEEI